MIIMHFNKVIFSFANFYIIDISNLIIMSYTYSQLVKMNIIVFYLNLLYWMLDRITNDLEPEASNIW